MQLFEEAIDLLKEVRESADCDTFVNLIHKARGILIAPSFIKAGFVIGGCYGEGFVLAFGPEQGEYFGPCFVRVYGASVGFQAGVQMTGLLLVIMNDRGLEGFTHDNVTLGGNFGAAIGPIGRHLSVDTDINLRASIYSYSINKGIFLGVSAQGAIVKIDHEKNEKFHKQALSAGKILKETVYNFPNLAGFTQIIDEMRG